jgi:predicted nucleic acid-binding protein
VILADTSIWVDHLRDGDDMLARLLGDDRVAMHPFVRGEISLGRLRDRAGTLEALDTLPLVRLADDSEVRRLIEAAGVFGQGIGYVDAHLLAAARLSPDTKLWSRDKRLAAAAERLGVAARVMH